MDDKHHKRLIWLIYILSVATLVLIISLGIYMSVTNNQLTKMNDAIKTISENKIIPTPSPIPGKDGYTPIKGIDYFDGISGRNGKDSISTNTTIIKETPIPGKDGQNGKNGTPGLQLEMKVDPSSCLLMTRYQGDESWTIQAQLPKPCEVL